MLVVVTAVACWLGYNADASFAIGILPQRSLRPMEAGSSRMIWRAAQSPRGGVAFIDRIGAAAGAHDCLYPQMARGCHGRKRCCPQRTRLQNSAPQGVPRIA